MKYLLTLSLSVGARALIGTQSFSCDRCMRACECRRTPNVYIIHTFSAGMYAVQVLEERSIGRAGGRSGGRATPHTESHRWRTLHDAISLRSSVNNSRCFHRARIFPKPLSLSPSSNAIFGTNVKTGHLTKTEKKKNIRENGMHVVLSC